MTSLAETVPDFAGFLADARIISSSAAQVGLSRIKKILALKQTEFLNELELDQK